MNINIFNILEMMTTSNTLIHYKDANMVDLCAVCIFPQQSTDIKTDMLYIVKECDIKDLPENTPLHVIIIGNVPEDFENGTMLSVSSVPEGTNALIFLYEIQGIFDAYMKWENDIMNSILNGESLQTIFDLCARFLKNPIALFDSQQTLIMKAGNIPEDLGGSLWDFVLTHGYSPRESDNQELNNLFKTNKLPFYFRSTNQFHNINRLIAGIRVDNSIFGCLALSDITEPFTQGEYANVYYIQGFMEKALLNSKEYLSDNYETPWYVSQLLKGSSIDLSVVSYNFSRYGEILKKPYYLCTFIAPNEQQHNKIKEFLPNLSYIFQTNMAFLYANQIIIIDFDINNYDNHDFLEKTDNYVQQNNLKCGYSMIFSDIMDLHQAFMQSQIAINEAKDLYVSDFKKSYVSYILHALEKENEADGLLYPDIKKLLNKDKAYGKELLKTLQEYIIQGKNVSATAEALYVHRHTVQYRLNYIQDTLKIELSKLKEDHLFLLYLSCRILGVD